MAQDHAVVAGASMVGLLVAEVLSETYGQVTVVEPDEIVDPATVRRGVPQTEHAHMLLARGGAALEELLPGLRAELAAAGARVEPVRVGPDAGMRLVGPAGPFTDAACDATMVGVTRGLLESVVRARVLARPTVRVRTGHRGVGLRADARGGRVTGLVVREGARPDGAHEVVEADLVVDATGRRSSAPRWLTHLGFDPAPETTIDADVSYASRRYRRPASPAAGWDGTVVTPRVGANPRFGGLLPVEDGECVVTMGGMSGHRPPADDDGFTRWSWALADPCVAEAIAESEPLSPIRSFRVPSSRLRHYDRLARWPDGFLVLGDAVCAFNPIYGQGMSVGALEALVLRDALRRSPHSPERSVRREVARVVASPWALAATEDVRWAGTRRPAWARIRENVVDAARAAATMDPVVARSLVEVMLMLAEPSSMMRPRTVRRVIIGRRRALRRPDPAVSDAVA